MFGDKVEGGQANLRSAAKGRAIWHIDQCGTEIAKAVEYCHMNTLVSYHSHFSAKTLWRI